MSEHDHLRALPPSALRAVCEFLLWLDDKGLKIAWSDSVELIEFDRESRQDLVGTFFHLDFSKLDAERQEMLDRLHAKV